MPFDQSNRLLQIVPPTGTGLDPNEFVLTSFTGREEMSRLFSFQLELLSHKQDVAPSQIVGRPITFSIEQATPAGVTRRHFSGIVNRFTAGMWDKSDKGEGVQHYHAEVVPWLWLLTRTSDCRIFQNETIPDIIKKVLKVGDLDFSGSKFVDFSGIDPKLHAKWEYCVQYRETHFNFISRLMEQEGIFYYFKPVFNTTTKAVDNVLCLCSKPQYLEAKPKVLDFRHTASNAYDIITSWVHQFEFRPGHWTQKDYDYTAPRGHMVSPLLTTGQINEKYYNEDKFKMYDFPAEYEVKEDPAGYNESITKIRQEEDETPQDVVQASIVLPGLSPGVWFEVGEHPNASEKKKQYVVTSIQHTARETTLTGGGGRSYTATFSCIPQARTFRPARITAKPSIQGTQTATVVGPPGKEIHTDIDDKKNSYMSVKVHFPWDREPANENSSCWIRVSQPWAGKNWGAMFIPRVGQEVVVAFLEGDPDRPIIVGSVYNFIQRPAYLGNGKDPKHVHDPNITGIKTNSTPGGKGYNELRFNDTAGKEQIFIHAQKDLEIRARNDIRQRALGHQHLMVGGEKDGKKWGDLMEEVYKDTHLKVHGSTDEHVEGDIKLLIGYGEKAGGNLDVMMKENRTELIEGESNTVIKKGAHLDIPEGDMSVNVSGAKHVKVGGDYCSEGKEVHIKAGMKIVLEAGLQISLKVGSNFVNINSAGVQISGSLVQINSGGAAGTVKPAKPKEAKKAKKAAPKRPTKADMSKSGFKSAYEGGQSP